MNDQALQVLVEQDRSEGVWATSVPGLNWLSTYAETGQEALGQTRQAILGYFEAAQKAGLSVPPGDAEPEVCRSRGGDPLSRLPAVSGRRVVQELSAARPIERLAQTNAATPVRSEAQWIP